MRGRPGAGAILLLLVALALVTVTARRGVVSPSARPAAMGLSSDGARLMRQLPSADAALADREVTGVSDDCWWLDEAERVVGDRNDLLARPPASALTPVWPAHPIVPRYVWRVASTGRFDHTTELGWLLIVRGPPHYPENPYIAATRARAGDGGPSLEMRLARRLLAGPAERTPSDVLAAVLAVTDGDYPLAALVGHNLLKELAYADRLGTGAIVGWPATRDDAVPRFDDGPVDRDILSTTAVRHLSERLVSLRAVDDPSWVDRLGPWYHLFGVLLVGALGGGGEARLAAAIENGLRRAGVASPRDPGKEHVNSCAADLAARIAGFRRLVDRAGNAGHD